LFAPAALGVGKISPNCREIGLMRAAGITLPGKHAAAPATVHVPVASGSFNSVSFPFDPKDWEKSPRRSSSVGITPSCDDPAMPRKLSQLPRKNVLLCPS